MIPLNKPNSNYTQQGNLFVSVLIDIKQNCTGTIQKPTFDYGNKEGKFLPYVYDSGSHMFHVHRFMKFNHLKDSLTNNSISLCFISPEKWFDPFEQLLYNSKKPLTCMCCTYERTECEEAAWNRSINEKEQYVRVSYDYNNLRNYLKQYGDENNLRFYITVADYTNSIEQLRKAKKMSTSSEKEYISLLTLKRKAFAYENELRIFAIGDDISVNNGLLKINIPCAPKKLISYVTLPPYPPFDSNDIRNPYYSSIQYLYNLGMRKELEKYQFPNGIWQSHLYETKERDRIVEKIKKLL